MNINLTELVPSLINSLHSFSIPPFITYKRGKYLMHLNNRKSHTKKSFATVQKENSTWFFIANCGYGVIKH